MFQLFATISNELTCDSYGVLPFLFTEDDVSVVNEKHVEIHHSTGAAVQGVGVLPADIIVVVDKAEYLVTGHGVGVSL